MIVVFAQGFMYRAMTGGEILVSTTGMLEWDQVCSGANQ